MTARGENRSGTAGLSPAPWTRRATPPFAITAVSIVIAALLATTTHAYIAAGETTGVDTPYTPIAKEPPEGMFTLEAGTRYEKPEANERNLIADSPTTFESDLHAVSFRDSKRGFAGGSELVDGVERPVLYSYERSKGWRRAEGFPASERGFIGAIAWIDADRALAVGGDGSYPERERAGHSCTEGGDPQRDERDGAGMARAWLYEPGEGWRELDRGKEMPDSVRALTALDFYVPAPGKPAEFGIAGGMCQIWHWADGGFMRSTDGSFEPPFSGEVSQGHPKYVERLTYRVRAIELTRLAVMDPPISRSERRPDAYAALAGCCGADLASTVAAERTVLQYRGAGETAPENSGTWSVAAVNGEPPTPQTSAAFPDSFVSVMATRGWNKLTWLPGYVLSKPPEIETKPPGLIATPLGSFDQGLEPSSTVGHERMATAGQASPVTEHETGALVDAPGQTWLSGIRLLDGAGDLGGSRAARSGSAYGNARVQAPVEPDLLWVAAQGGEFGIPSGSHGARLGGREPTIPDGIPDWSVGELTSTAQAAIYATDPSQLEPPPSAAEHPPTYELCNFGTLQPDQSLSCQLGVTSEYPARVGEQHENPMEDSKRPAESIRSHRLLKLPTYALHAVDFIDEEQTGWAVGKHGGIVRFGSAPKRRQADEQPAELGKAEEAATPPDELWAPEGEPPSETGVVPPLSRSPSLQLPERQLAAVSDRLPNASRVTDIVMSRDGSEGWAFGQGVLIHYDGGSWSVCGDADSQANHACTGSKELGLLENGVRSPVRVPRERDRDPTNDDEFEVAILGGPSGLVRYRGGRWEAEDDAALSEVGEVPGGATALAFVTPSDAWVQTDSSNPIPGQVTPPEFWRFDGEKWRKCPDRACDPHQRFTRPMDGSRTVVAVQKLRTAGDRVYVVGHRVEVVGTGFVGRIAPFIAYRSADEAAWSEGPRKGEYDPSIEGPASTPLTANQRLADASVIQRPDGLYEGWAVGTLARTSSLRLGADGAWERFRDEGATGEQQMPSLRRPAIVRRRDGLYEAYAAPTYPSVGYRYDPLRVRWAAAPLGMPVAAIAPDNRGGVWIIKPGSGSDDSARFYSYTDSPRKPVFEEVAQPSRLSARLPITSLSASSDGTLWATTPSQVVYRYSRALGWTTLRIPGWEPGRTVSAPSPAHAVAVDRRGHGYIVGAKGRIARIDRGGVRLDPAAGTLCAARPSPPCSTGRDLKAVAVSDDGSAMAGGQGGSLLWRPPGGGFRAVKGPPVDAGMDLVSVAIGPDGAAWVLAESGELYRGSFAGEDPTWVLEVSSRKLNAFAVGDDGRGLAAGDDGFILERSPMGGSWTELPAPTVADLTAVALPQGEGRGGLIGGANGVVLTFDGERVELARAGDTSDDNARQAYGIVHGIALAPGRIDGQVEAWASTSRTWGAELGTRLLHSADDPTEPLLQGGAGTPPAPDSSEPRPGELTFAAFGKSDCHTDLSRYYRCGPMWGTTEFAEVVTSRIVEEIAERSRHPSGPIAALFSGDAIDSAGWQGGSIVEEVSARNSPYGLEGLASLSTGSGGGAQKLRRWGELVADRLTDLGVPLFGAIGGRDLSETRTCVVAGMVPCVSAEEREEVAGYGRAGDNTHWRQAMLRRSRPWGAATAPRLDRYRFRSVRSPLGAVSVDNREVGDPDGEAPAFRVPSGGAPTHYAIDVSEPATGRKLVRLVFADTSQGSLSGSEALQQPRELAGTQAAWLEQVLCTRGSAASATCTRDPGQQAIFVTNAPTYSYGPGAGLQTAADGAAIEAILVKNRVNLAVTGKIGWNGLYWTSAPGVHHPCPGGGYPKEAPTDDRSLCGTGAPADPTDAPREATATVGAALTGDVSLAGTPVSGAEAGSLPAPIPFLIASSAGGKLAGAADGTAGEGFWHGYSIVRLDASGDPRKTIVEQRPIYDWIGIEGAARVLRPGQVMRLRGFGRAPIGTRTNSSNQTDLRTRYDVIDGPAVTHRYDLLQADPNRPWLPLEDETRQYVPLDPSIAAVDSESGAIRVGRGNNPRTFAVAMLSVGDRAATYPLVFEPRRTFAPKPSAVPTRAPSVVVQSAAATAAVPPSPGAPPQAGSVSPPVLPSFPPAPPPPAVPPTAQPQPAPPPPPAPPPSAPTALELAPAPPGLTVAPPASVIPPPAPPINPAPPGGARKEARQRQAATEKSGSDAAQGSGDEHQVDLVDKPMDAHGGSQMTRRDRVKAEPSFSAVSRGDQPSTWARGALYGTGLTLAALALAGGFTARPRPRGRRPAAPAPAWARRPRP